jgi:hypothetical protein
VSQWINPQLVAEIRAQIADGEITTLRAKLAAAESRAERYRHLLADIKQWDISQFMSIPHLLRERMQSALAEGDAG